MPVPPDDNMKNKALSQPVSLPVIIVVLLMFAAMLYVLFYLTFGRQSTPANAATPQHYAAAPRDSGHTSPFRSTAVGATSGIRTGE